MKLAAVALAPIVALGFVPALVRGLAAEVQVPEPRAPLAVRAGPQGSTLLEVAQAYAGALGLELAASPQDLERLAAARTGLVADLAAPPAEVHAAAQSLLLLGGFAVTSFEGRLALAAWPVQGVEPLAVAEEELARLAGHEALYVRAEARIEGLEARVAATALRVIATGAASATTVAAPDDRTLVVSGPAGGVQALLAHIRAAVAPAAAPPAVDWSALFPEPSAGLALAPKDTLMSALERYVAATGLRVWVEPRLRQELASAATGLPAPLDVEPGRVHAVVEALLARRGVAFSVLGTGGSALHVAQGSVQACAPRPVLLDLEHEDAARLADHPATLFGAALHLPETEVRTLTTTLRSLVTDTLTCGMLGIADHALYVQAPGATEALLGGVVLGLEGRKLGGEPTAAGFGADVVLAGDAGERPALVRLLDEPSLLAPAAAGRPSGGAHRLVPAGELDAPGRPAAQLVTTLIEVPHLEVRATATRLRAGPEPGLDHLVPCGDHTMLVGGRLEDVRARVAELRALDEQAAAKR